MIKEVIVVEGRDDIIKVNEAVDATVIATHGYGFGEKFLNKLKSISKDRGIIVLTDPDPAGRRIRERIKQAIPDAKHAYIPMKKSLKNGDIGVENARPEDIREAISNAKPFKINPETIYEMSDLFKYRLTGTEGAKERREKLSTFLNLGESNAKELIKRLNAFQIPKEKFLEALEKING